MTNDGAARYVISHPQWGEIKILRPVPCRGDRWGVLAPLKGTPWGALISEVNGEALSHALHGRLRPLMTQIGPEPRLLLRRVPEGLRRCSLATTCPLAKAVCHPCPKVPACYEPPGLGSSEAGAAAAMVVLAWAEGRYVIVPTDTEFGSLSGSIRGSFE